MKKYIKRILLILAILLGFQSVSYAKINTDVINERWGKPTYVFGETLNDEQVESTAKLLGITNRENVNYIDVTYDDLLKYIGGDKNNRANMISSVLVQKESEGHGVEVIIETPENITEVSSLTYENASITAGVKDATIQVAAIRPVTGESALTGIYKAFEANGEVLDKDRMEAAQEELIVVNKINQENKGKEDFTSEKFNEIIIDIKNELSNININSNNQNINHEEITNVINQTINKYDLQDVISPDQINRLTSYFERYVNTDALNSPEVQAQLKDLSNKVIKGAKDIYNKADEAGLVDQILNFIKSIFESIVNIFAK